MSIPVEGVRIDADSHIMELPDFLIVNADPRYRDVMPRIAMDSPEQRAVLGAIIDRGGRTPDELERIRAFPGDLLAGRKDYLALGAFDPAERGLALDMLGFSRQVVFPSFAEIPAFWGSRPPELRYAIARAANRGMARFCATDPRLHGVGVLPINDPARAEQELEALIAMGLRIVWIAHEGSEGLEFRPRELEAIWTRLAASDTLLSLHALPFPAMRSEMDRGSEIVPVRLLDGDDSPRSEASLAPSGPVERFLSSMILDGVFERHRGLKCAVVELGAGWVPGLMHRLDALADRIAGWSGKSGRKPSEQILEQIVFTPHHQEDLGALIAATDSRLYLFSTDYPHIEGGTNPIGRFEESLARRPSSQRGQFFHGNFERIFD